MDYYLTQFDFDAETSTYTPQGFDLFGDWSIIDLRDRSNLSGGYCLLATPSDTPTSRDAIQIASGKGETLTAGTLGRVNTALGIDLARATLSNTVAEIMTTHAPALGFPALREGWVDGQTRRGKRINLGGEELWRGPTRPAEHNTVVISDNFDTGSEVDGRTPEDLNTPGDTFTVHDHNSHTDGTSGLFAISSGVAAATSSIAIYDNFRIDTGSLTHSVEIEYDTKDVDNDMIIGFGIEDEGNYLGTGRTKGYLYLVYDFGTGNLFTRLDRQDDGSTTQLHSFHETSAATTSAHTLTCTEDGGVQTCEIGGVSDRNGTDTTYGSSGHTFVAIVSITSNSTRATYDNFVVDNLGVAPEGGDAEMPWLKYRRIMTGVK